MTIGKLVKQYRKKSNITQDELAKKLHVGRSTIANWEADRNLPDIHTLSSIAEILNIPLNNLLHDTVYKKRKKKLFIVVLCILFIILGCIMFNNLQFQDVHNPKEIKSVIQTDDAIEVLVDLPKYRSLIGYTSSSSEKDEDINITLINAIDFSGANIEKLIITNEDLQGDYFKVSAQ